jgi:hypothetical protein
MLAGHERLDWFRRKGARALLARTQDIGGEIMGRTKARTTVHDQESPS